jgi:hypothetical protein
MPPSKKPSQAVSPVWLAHASQRSLPAAQTSPVGHDAQGSPFAPQACHALPARQTPAPVPHPRQTHSPETHVSPAGQSALVQQVPLSHDPLQQMRPAPHCRLFWQATQVLPAQIGVGLAHCASVQQVPTRHCPLQQTSPASHCSLVWQGEQVLLRQTCRFGHCALVQQSPRRHSPPQQTSPLPHCPLARQPTQTWSSQTGFSGSGQSLLRQQVPVKHEPPQQTWPAPHWPLLVQPVQRLPEQIGVGFWHCRSAQQSPAWQRPSQQTWPAPHCSLV